MMTSLADVSLIYQKCCLPNYRIQLVTFIDFIFLPWCFFGSFFNYFSIININNVYCMFSKSAGNFLPTTNQWMNKTNHIISVNQLELCCHWVQNLQSEKICSLSLDQAIFLISCAVIFPSRFIVQSISIIVCTNAMQHIFDAKIWKKNLNILFHIMKKWLYTLVTKFVWQSINTPQCYDNTKVDQILII